MPYAIQLFDGYGVAAEQIGNPIFEYPFAQNGDLTSRTLRRTFKQRPQYYQRTQLGTPDQQYGNMYLISESEPVFTTTGLYQFVQVFANIPATQTTYSSRSISKPAVPNEFATTPSINDWPSSTTTATAVLNNTGWFLSDDRVFAPFFTGSAVYQLPTASAGTFTITFGANTTAALAYNAADATINTAINGLASVIAAGITVSVGNTLSTTGGLSITLTVSSTASLFTMNPASLTVTQTKNAFTRYTTTTAQTISLGQTVTASTNTLDATKSLLLVYSANSAAYVGTVYPSGYWAKIDANNVSVTPLVNNQNLTSYAANYLRTYTAGVTQIASVTMELFYLPGAAGQVATPAAIPITQPVVSDQDLIAAILAGGGTRTVAFDGPMFWRESSMYTTRNTKVNLDNL